MNYMAISIVNFSLPFYVVVPIQVIVSHFMTILSGILLFARSANQRGEVYKDRDYTTSI